MKIAEQSKTMFRYRDLLKKRIESGELKLKQLKELLHYNHQRAPDPCGEEAVSCSLFRL